MKIAILIIFTALSACCSSYMFNGTVPDILLKYKSKLNKSETYDSNELKYVSLYEILMLKFNYNEEIIKDTVLDIIQV